VTDSTGTATIGNTAVTAEVGGFAPALPVTLTTGQNGETTLTVGSSGHVVIATTLTGAAQGTAVNVSMNQNTQQNTIQVTQPSGRTINIILVQFPEGSNVGLNLSNAQQIVSSVTNAAGQAMNVDIQAQDSGGDIVFTITYHPPTANGTAKTVYLAPGGSMTITASGIPANGVYRLAIGYSNVPLGQTSESALRLMKVVPGSPLAAIGTNDRGNTAATATLGDYGIDTSSKKVWANVDTLGTFAIGVPKEAVEVVTSTVTGYGCLPPAVIVLGLMWLGFVGIKRV
jgi:hypothetical protein